MALQLPFTRRKAREEIEAEAKRAAIKDSVAALVKAVGATTPTPVMPGSQFQGGWNNLGNAAMAMVQRVSQNMAQQHNVPIADIEAELVEQGLTWGPPFPPGRPLDPFFGFRRPPRTWDFQVGENVQITPRWNRVSFKTIKAIYDAYDVAQICVRRLVNDVRTLDHTWVPLQGIRDDVSEDIAQARQFFEFPDRRQPFRNWLAEWLQDVLRYDAGTLYIRRTEDGTPFALEVVSGDTIIPLVDYYGRIAADEQDDDPPVDVWDGGDTPSYVQIIQGMPWDWLTADDILYQAWNPLPESQYGLSPLESVLMTANTDLRFQWHFLQYFTEGTIPAGFMEAPPDMSDPAQIAEWQETWDALMMGDQAKLRQIRWVPANAKFTAVKSGDFDEKFPLYLMRRVAASYGVTPNDLGFTEDVNRAVGETQVDVQHRVGTMPVVCHVEDVINLFVAKELKLRCRLQFEKGQETEDRVGTAQADKIYVEMGAKGIDEVRGDLGLPVNRERPVPRFIQNPRVGPIPLIALESLAGKIDEETYGPDPAQPLISNPYMPVPGTLPQMGTPELKAVSQASAQMGDDMLQQTTGSGPTPQMQQAIAAATPPPAPAQTAATAALPDETPPSNQASKGELSAGLGATSGIQGDPLASGSGDEDDDDERDDDEVTKALSLELELRRWRDNSRQRLRKGKPPRRFHSEFLTAETVDLVWSHLEHARTRGEVDAIFDAALGKAGARRAGYRPRSRIVRPR